MNHHSIHIEKQFAAPVERVFRAWTTPEALEQWAWGSLGKDTRATVDLRVEGKFHISTAVEDGSRWAFFGTYTEIEPDRRLAYTLSWDAPMGYHSSRERVVVEFAEVAGMTTVLFNHMGVPGSGARKEHAKGWENTFMALVKLLERE
jgi:uncharacterized protein YndB with AHSA1/START domain